MLIFASGLVFLALYYQNHFARTKRKEAELLLKVSLESEMKERHRIAADLHDSVCGDLVAIKFFLGHLNGPNADAENRLAIDEIGESLDNALENTRMLSYRLMPPLLETMGLCAALGEHFKRLTAKTAIPFVLHCDISPALNASDAYELFRVVQEFNTNMLKYGSITKCELTISMNNGQLQMVIEDDGEPYDFDELSADGKGAGLQNISSRLKVINAQLSQEKVLSGNKFTIILNPKPC